MHKDAREVAVRILRETGDTSRASYFEGLKDPRDRALAHQLAAGSLKWRGLLDHCLGEFSSRKLESLRPDLLAALRVGAYQLLFTAVPQYAAVDSVVRLQKHPGERSFANGVLRSVARTVGHVSLPDLDEDPASYLSTRFSHPSWMSKLLIDRFGLALALLIAQGNNLPPPLTLRLNLSRVARERYLASLKAEGHRAEPGLSSPAVRLLNGADVTELPGFSEGLFVVQDEGGGAISAALGPEPGDRVWDVCAAPGGKTSHLAEMAKSGQVFATDVDPDRVAMIDETIKRLGLPNVITAVMDATTAPKVAGKPFDRILLDAPCSGLGVLGRHPDLRWNRRESDIATMASRQAAMLRNAAPNLAVGGILVYSTCTLTRDENEGVWHGFLRGHPGFAGVDPAIRAGEYAPLFAGDPFTGDGYRYILPGPHSDGFFVACAVRKE